MMKRLTTIGLFAVAAGVLSGCGVRGDLDRPPPIFSSPPNEEARQPVSSAVEVAAAPERAEDEAYYNGLGGEIPKADPEADIGETGLDEVSPD